VTTNVEQEMAAVRGGRWLRRRRVDQCLLRGGDWFALDLMRCTGLGSGAVYVRLAQLEAAGFVTSMLCADGRRQYVMVDETLIRHCKQRFHAAMQRNDEAVS
jgi:predicted transcriptional regulator